MAKTVYVVTYFYPGGIYAGIIGVYDTPLKADTAIAEAKQSYGDCTFITTTAEVE